MKRFFVGLMIAVACQAAPVFAQDGTATEPDHAFSYDSEVEPGSGVIHWKIINDSSSDVALKFFVRKSSDSSRMRWTWPTADSHQTVSAGASLVYTTRNCVLGEQICYGASENADFYGSGHWGIGIEGRGACDNCCAVCQAQEELYDSLEIHRLKD